MISINLTNNQSASGGAVYQNIVYFLACLTSIGTFPAFSVAQVKSIKTARAIVSPIHASCAWKVA